MAFEKCQSALTVSRDWCLREGRGSWVQDRPDPGCHFKQADRGEKPCLMASLPQNSDASHLGRPQRKP